MKRIISLVLALSMVLSMFPVAFAGTGLKDINGTKYEAAVEALMELGVVSGYPNGTYLPENVVTRAELAKLLVVAYGLLPAAEASKGLTPFGDVNAEGANYWAAGYINVAADYKFINGYPDGTFGGNATVTYAEAITMCLRVLGYANVIEAKGTWPTNYIAKAQELGLTDGVSFKSYNDGATRGNIALLIWNMLQQRMWDVTGESEGDGLQFTAGKKMVEVKFPDYTLVEDVYVFDIKVADRKVTVDLEAESGENLIVTVYEDVELAEGIDFLKLFGRKVTALYNKEDKVLATITPSVDDKVVEEKVLADITEDYNESSSLLTWGANAENATLFTAVVGSTKSEGKKDLRAMTKFDASKTGYVEEIKESKSGKLTIDVDNITLTNLTESDVEDIIVLIDGEWAYLTDVEVGDILTELVANELYIVSRATVEGEFEAYNTVKVKGEDDRTCLEVDGEEFEDVVAGNVVVLDEDGEVDKTFQLADLLDEDEDDETVGTYFGEEVKLYMNFLGEVARVEFAEVTDEDKVVGNFYVLTNAKNKTWEVSDRNGVTKYIELNGETYELEADVTEIDSGDVVYATFDGKDRVTDIEKVKVGTPTGKDDKYDVFPGTEEIGATKDNYISGYKVTSSTVVVTITAVKDEENEKTVAYEVETSEGPDALEGIDESIILVEKADGLKRAKYVFVREDAKNTDELVGILESTRGSRYATIDGEEYEIDNLNGATVGDIVVFTNDEEDGIAVVRYYNTAIIDAVENEWIVKDAVEARFVEMYTSDVTLDLDVEDKIEGKDVEDYRFFMVEAEEDEAGVYEFTSMDEVDFEDIKLKDDDRLYIDNTNGYLFIIRGIEVSD